MTTTFSKQCVETLPQVIQTDSDDNLELYCYTSCSMEDSEIVKQSRGVVFHGDELVLKAYPYTDEYEVEDIPAFDVKEMRFFESHEGFIIRVFHFGDKWYISTHRKLDAFKSRWGTGLSFGMIFVKALENTYLKNIEFQDKFKPKEEEDKTGQELLDEFLTLLDKDRKYIFLVQNIKENRIVCQPPYRPGLFSVGYFDGSNILHLEPCLGIKTPKELTFQSRDELVTYVRATNYNHLQGIIAVKTEPELHLFKVMNSDYIRLFQLRGNVPSLKVRYLQVRKSPTLRRDFCELYPERTELFEACEDALMKVAKVIREAYISRFIKKEYITIPSDEYYLVKELHKWHIEDRENHRISEMVVWDLIQKQDVSILNRMITRHLRRDKEQ
jgi:hypothetical protein